MKAKYCRHKWQYYLLGLIRECHKCGKRQEIGDNGRYTTVRPREASGDE